MHFSVKAPQAQCKLHCHYLTSCANGAAVLSAPREDPQGKGMEENGILSLSNSFECPSSFSNMSSSFLHPEHRVHLCIAALLWIQCPVYPGFQRDLIEVMSNRWVAL